MATFTELKGFDNISEPSIEGRLKSNIPAFFDWGFVSKGGFLNVRLSSSGQYNEPRARLTNISDPRFSGGQVWQAVRKNWVWESGVSTTTQPIRISGVNVNGTFFPSNTSGAFSHYIDYPNGRVIFNNPIPTSSLVQLEYSYKFIQVVEDSKTDWIKYIQFNSNVKTSGNLADQQLQLPLVCVEISTRTTYSPYMIGTLAQFCYKDIIFHVIAEDDNTCSKIADIIGFQKDKTIYLYDDALLLQSGVQPLNSRGSINTGAKTYPQLVEPVEEGGFRWRKARFSDSTIQKTNKYDKFFVRQVKMTVETVLT